MPNPVVMLCARSDWHARDPAELRLDLRLDVLRCSVCDFEVPPEVAAASLPAMYRGPHAWLLTEMLDSRPVLTFDGDPLRPTLTFERPSRDA